MSSRIHAGPGYRKNDRRDMRILIGGCKMIDMQKRF
jgi:hypothetical protein